MISSLIISGRLTIQIRALLADLELDYQLPKGWLTLWTEPSELNQNRALGTFTVSVPLSGQTNENVLFSQNNLVYDDDFSFLSGKTILVVDDNRFVHEIINLHLQLFNVNILSAESGSEAIEIVKQQTPDFIFMDLVMPGMSGFETTLYIRAMYPKIPISAITAHSLPKDRQKAFLAGCDEIITKPIYRNILLHMLKRYLKKED